MTNIRSFDLAYNIKKLRLFEQKVRLVCSESE